MNRIKPSQTQVPKYILCFGFFLWTIQIAWSQQTITGIVTNVDNTEPLIGVNIQVKDAGVGTVSEIDGTYSIDAPANATTLVISYIGFTTQEIEIAGRSVIDIALSAGAVLDEVVVIGYGTQKRADITGSVAYLNAEKLAERPLQRVDQALVGQMAGVRVQQTSGVPGRGFRVQVRGTGSISANNEPLYVIDGFPLEVAAQTVGGTFTTGNPLDNINPNDIESIQVLKDASAAAIYGSAPPTAWC